MGFLSNLIKREVSNGVRDGVRRGVSDGVGNGIRNAVGGAVEKAFTPTAEKWANKAADDLDTAAGNMESTAKETNSAFSNLARATENYANALDQAAKNSNYAAAPVNYSDNANIYEEDGIDAAVKIRKVLAESFPQYEVRENVSPTTIGGTGRFMNYSFAVYSAGSPKLFIMLVGKTTCSTRLYRWSSEQAGKAGVTMINFVQHYPNNVNYIKNRLQSYL